MNVYEEAWKNIVKPTQITTKKHHLGPVQRTIDGCTIRRVDLEVTNRNKKRISGFLYYCEEA